MIIHLFLFLLAFAEQVDALNAQQEEQTEMLMKKSEQNQALEVQILSQTSEIDNLKEEIRRKMEEFHASDDKSKQLTAEFEEKMSSKSIEFSTSIENLKEELSQKSNENSTLSQEIDTLKKRISELEESEVEKQKLAEKTAALRNKAKVCSYLSNTFQKRTCIILHT